MAIIKKTYSVDESIIDTGKRIMINNIFYGYFLASLNKLTTEQGGKELEKLIKTAAVGKDSFVGGYKLYINNQFWESLTQEQREAVMEHELHHILNFHPTMSQSFAHKEIFNIAADLQINQYVKNLPDNGMSLEEYINFMRKAKDDIESGKICPPMRPCRLDDFGFKKEDEHQSTRYYYDRLIAMANDPKNKSKAAQNLRKMVEDMQSGSSYPCSHESWKEFEEMSQEERELIDNTTRGIIKRIMSEAKTTEWGNIPGYLRELIENILRNRPPVYNWKAHFKRLVAKSLEYLIKSTRIKPNRRIEENSTIKFDPKMHIMSFLDTSGSMSDEDIIQCFTEINHFYKTGHTISVGETDASFNPKKDMYEYKGKYPKARLGLSGGGGTSCDPALSYIRENEKKYSLIVYLTDGYMAAPKIKIKTPLIWVITKTGANPEDLRKAGFYGQIIKMNDDC